LQRPASKFAVCPQPQHKVRHGSMTATTSTSTLTSGKKILACNTRMSCTGTMSRLRHVELNYTLPTPASSSSFRTVALAKKCLKGSLKFLKPPTSALHDPEQCGTITLPSHGLGHRRCVHPNSSAHHAWHDVSTSHHNPCLEASLSSWPDMIHYQLN